MPARATGNLSYRSWRSDSVLMARCCEVCRTFRPEASDSFSQNLLDVELDKRAVTLCSAHFYLWRCAKVTTLDGLRTVFRESTGRRSFVSRRAPSEPPKSSEWRRRSAGGRRASDP